MERFRLAASEIPPSGQAFQTYAHEWLFAEDVARRLRDFSGIEILSTEDVATGRPLPWFHIYATHELPAMHPDTTGLERESACPKCHQDNYYRNPDEPLQIVYDGGELDVDDLPDVSHTFEHFGNSGLRDPFEQSYFAQPILVLKPVVLKALQDAKVRHLHPYPVTIR